MKLTLSLPRWAAVVFGLFIVPFLTAQEDQLNPENQTDYYIDVTATHVPQAPELHALDAVFVDVDNNGTLDVVLAVEYGVNRLYLNDGSGKLTYKEGAFGKGAHDSEHVLAADFDQDGHLDFIFVAEDDHVHQYF